MASLLLLESQPRFPYDDLTETNAEMLELLLANDDMVAKNHIAAENVRRVFKIGHQCITRAGHRLDYETGKFEAVDTGTAIFEAMSAMINVTPHDTNAFKLSDMRAGLEGGFDEEKIRSYFIDSYDCFREENPLAAGVVRNASRLPSRMTEYAVLGAAISRHFEIDTNQAA